MTSNSGLESKVPYCSELGQKKSTTQTLLGICTLIGGILLNIVAGNLLTWGMIYPYIGSYLRSLDSSVSFSEVYSALPLSFLIENIGVFAAPFLIRIGGTRKTLLEGGALTSLSFMICSLLKSSTAVVWTYAVLFGTGAGIITITSFFPAWDHFPRSRGMVTGFIMSGYSASNLVFGLLFTYLANPTNKEPTNLDFGEEVNRNIPYVMLLMGLVFAGVTIVGVFLVREARVHTQALMSAPLGEFSVRQMLSERQFWGMFFLGYTVFFFWYFFVGVFKSYGLQVFGDDHFLAYIGSMAGAAGGVGRVFWPSLLDYFSFRKVMTCSMILQLVGCSSLHFIVANKYLYGAVVVVLFFCCSAVYPSLAVETNNIFHPYSSQVWPFIYLAATLASISSIVLKYIGEAVGYFYIYAVCSLVILTSIVLLGTIRREPVKWAKSKEIQEVLLDQLLKI